MKKSNRNLILLIVAVVFVLAVYMPGSGFFGIGHGIRMGLGLGMNRGMTGHGMMGYQTMDRETANEQTSFQNAMDGGMMNEDEGMMENEMTDGEMTNEGRRFQEMGRNEKLVLPGFIFYSKLQKDLGLSDAQIEKMRKIESDFQKEATDLKTELWKAETASKNAATVGGDIDESALLNAQERVLNAKDKLAKRGARYRLDLYNVLNKAQKAKINDVRANMRTKMTQNRMNMMGGKGPRGMRMRTR